VKDMGLLTIPVMIVIAMTGITAARTIAAPIPMVADLY
jgi:hypothetical protein